MDETINVHLSLKTPLDELGPEIHGFEGIEAVSELFQYRLFLHTPIGRDLSFSDLLGRDVTVSLRVDQQPERHLHGIFTELIRAGSDPMYRYYEAILVPKASLLQHQVGYRIVSDSDLKGILGAYLQGVPHRVHFHETHQRHDYTVKYGESSWNHLARLVEEEGCYFTFDHDDGGTIVFADDSRHAATIEHRDQLPSSVQGVEPHVRNWRTRQSMVAWKYHLDDYHDEAPNADLAQSEQQSSPITFGSREVRYDLPLLANCEVDEWESFAHRFRKIDRNGQHDPSGLDGMTPEKERLARVRLEQQTLGAFGAEGTSNYSWLMPGRILTLGDAGPDSGDYFITRIEHGVRISLHGSDYWEATPYTCRFEAIPKDVRYRTPRRTARRWAESLETATVVTDHGEEVTTNDLACVKARFPWDRDQGKKSCWMRTKQSLAGAGYGEVFLPRKDHEVVVMYEEGDPERPVVLGSLYNAKNPPPEAPSTHRHLQGYWSRSLGGGPENMSKFTIDHRLGQEEVTVHAERDAHFLTENDYQIVTGRNLDISVGYALLDGNTDGSGVGGDGGSTGGNLTQTSSGNWTETRFGKVVQHVAGDVQITVKGYVYVNAIDLAGHSYSAVWCMLSPTVLVAPSFSRTTGVFDVRLVAPISHFDVDMGLFDGQLHAVTVELNKGFYQRNYSNLAMRSSLIETDSKISWVDAVGVQTMFCLRALGRSAVRTKNTVARYLSCGCSNSVGTRMST
ncbi:Phage-related baseplate assembly protein [Planctomycetes bacterium Pan216]|uniref:Phage-related baseplate assembly protein n=1 Tax=Kolteria novifilia TaxID=2527975 RepID=A0A518AZ02_9BACT|nr:Phage-related baseplate assembly protein [Planctomycetes bacterium Pan216]